MIPPPPPPPPKKETNIMKLIMVKLSSIGFTMFRNNTAQAYVGNRAIHIKKDGSYPCKSGDIIVQQGRILHAGLTKGSSDLIGWKTIIVTPEMVGQKIAIFTAVEVKTQIGRATPEQKIFISNVENAGGIAKIMRSPDDELL